jgi:Putative zinc-finger
VTSGLACRQVRLELGVYLVGAITAADRDAVDSHLTGCTDCRAELAALAGLPALLGRGAAAEAVASRLGREPVAAPHQLLQTLLRRATRLRQRRRLQTRLAAAAAIMAIAGGGAAAAIFALDQPQARLSAAVAPQWAQTVQETNPRTHASATIRYSARPWGMVVDVQVSGIPAGTRCELEVVSARGQEIPSDSWMVARGHGGIWYSGSSSVPPSGARGFVIAAGTQALVTIPLR